MYKKYEIDKSKYRIEPDGTVLYRIKALRDVVTVEHSVKAGTYGGFIESERNLEQFRNAWIDADSIVRGKARVCGDSCVLNSTITDNATVCDVSMVMGSHIADDAVVSGTAIIINSLVSNNAIVAGATHLFRSCVCGNACMIGNDFFDGATIDRRYPENHYSLENKKFRLIPLKGEYEGFYRLKAKRDIENYQSPEPIKEGDLGGIVSGAYNLSINGECWIDYDSVVQGLASVFDYAYVSNSLMYGKSIACSSATIMGSILYQNAYVGGKAQVINSQLESKSRVYGSAHLISPVDKMMCYKSRDKESELNLSCSYDLKDQAETSLVHSNV